MIRGYRFLTSVVLASALAAPVAAMAGNAQQDNRNQENRQGDNRDEANRQGGDNSRYYDKSHKDYHTWDNNENSAYQRYQTQHHEKRSFTQLNTRKQKAYWNWRHNNPDSR